MSFLRLFRPKVALPSPRLRLVVFATEETLPWPLQLVHPAGLWGALTGIPVVMKPHLQPRLLLERPMEPGDYLFEGIDGSVVACVQERRRGEPYPGRDSGGDAIRVAGMGAQERDRLERARWVIALQLTELLSDVKDALMLEVDLADRLAALSDGVVLDQEAQRYYLPGRWRIANGTKPMDAREQVTMHLEGGEGGMLWVHTHGLAKFGRHEMELRDIPSDLGEAACRLLVDLSQQVINGDVLWPGQRVGDPQSPLQIRLRGASADSHYDGPSLELVDAGWDHERSGRGGARGVAAYGQSWGGRRAV